MHAVRAEPSHRGIAGAPRRRRCPSLRISRQRRRPARSEREGTCGDGHDGGRASAAYADLVAGLLDARPDPATERFDAELAAAEADGRIDAADRPVLRWWQREACAPSSSTRGSSLPPDAAGAGAGRGRRRPRGRGDAPRPGPARSPTTRPASRPDVAGGRRTTAPTTPRPPDAEQPARRPPSRAAPTDARRRRPVDEHRRDRRTPAAPARDLSEHRRRLLVAGLTRSGTARRH